MSTDVVIPGDEDREKEIKFYKLLWISKKFSNGIKTSGQKPTAVGIRWS
jgi:hypothetical protein